MLPPVSAPAAPAQAPAAVIAVVEVAAAAVVAVWRRRQRPQALCCRPGEIQKIYKIYYLPRNGKECSSHLFDQPDDVGLCGCGGLLLLLSARGFPAAAGRGFFNVID